MKLTTYLAVVALSTLFCGALRAESLFEKATRLYDLCKTTMGHETVFDGNTMSCFSRDAYDTQCKKSGKKVTNQDGLNLITCNQPEMTEQGEANKKICEETFAGMYQTTDPQATYKQVTSRNNYAPHPDNPICSTPKVLNNRCEGTTQNKTRQDSWKGVGILRCDEEPRADDMGPLAVKNNALAVKNNACKTLLQARYPDPEGRGYQGSTKAGVSRCRTPNAATSCPKELDFFGKDEIPYVRCKDEAPSQ